MLKIINNLNFHFIIFMISMIAVLSACGGYTRDLNDFKSSTTFSDLTNCLGLETEIITRAFKPSEVDSDDTLLMEASFLKNNVKFYSQWLYNKKLKISELVFLGKAGSDETVMIGNDFADLCGKSNSGTKLSDNLLLKNDSRKNKDYGIALATWGSSDEDKKRTIELSSKMNKLNIVNTRQVQTIKGSYAVITTSLRDQPESYYNAEIHNLDFEFGGKGMKLHSIDKIIILKPYIEVK
jgi:hypothetical protein